MKYKSTLLSVILGIAYLGSANATYTDVEQGKIAVANRASGSISIIDVQSDSVVNTQMLPAAVQRLEPMYVVYKNNRLYVGTERTIVWLCTTVSALICSKQSRQVEACFICGLHKRMSYYWSTMILIKQ